MSCPECFTGHIKPSEPKGRTADVHGRKTYVALPDTAAPVKGIVVIVPDAFGWEFVNNRLLADHYAQAGQFKVYLPDFMDGCAAPLWMMDVLPQLTKKRETWSDFYHLPYHLALALRGFIPFIVKNRFAVSMPKVQTFLEALRNSEDGQFAIGAAGFCWGGLHVLRLAHGMSTSGNKPLVDVVFTAHPSNIDIPEDIEKVRTPTSLAIGDNDFMMPVATVEKVGAIWERLEGVDTEITIYPGAGHGFSVRADPLNARQAEHSAAAETQAVRWFEKHFDARAR